MDEPITPRDLLDQARAARRTAMIADIEVLQAAASWADFNPDLTAEGQPEPYKRRTTIDDLDTFCPPHSDQPPSEWFGLPSIDWKAPADFAAAIGMTTAAGHRLIRDALILRHRLPRIWALLCAHELEAWRARKIADAVVSMPDDVCVYLDGRLAPIAGKVGVVTLEKLVNEAMMRLYPEQFEMDQMDALDGRYVKLYETSINDAGIADMAIRGDWADLDDFFKTVTLIAAKLGERDKRLGLPADSLDVRRARAITILANPADAAALLEDEDLPTRTPTKNVQAIVHITVDNLEGRNPVAREELLDRAFLDEAVRRWCGRTDRNLIVQPVIDLADHIQTKAYEATDRLKTHTRLTQITCVFPWCNHPARTCDSDHILDHSKGGTTCSCNIAALCRRHHRLKTHAGWSYTPIEPGVFLWRSPPGHQFLVNAAGTIDVTPDDGRIIQHCTQTTAQTIDS